MTHKTTLATPARGCEDNSWARGLALAKTGRSLESSETLPLHTGRGAGFGQGKQGLAWEKEVGQEGEGTTNLMTAHMSTHVRYHKYEHKYKRL